jgi:hypothetical protein
MKSNRIALVALVLSVIALGLSGVAVQRVTVAGNERAQVADDACRVEERLAVGQAHDAINYGENLDPEEITLRYGVSNEIVNLGPSLDPEVP